MVSYEFDYNDYPLIPIKIISEVRETPVIDALLDSGGDFIVIPKPIADYLELKCEDAGCVDTAGGETTLWKSQVRLEMVSNSGEYVYSDLEIHVSERDDIPVLLGRHPVFEDHEIIFRKNQNRLILSPIDTP